MDEENDIPVWLAEWPTTETLYKWFSPSVRSLAERAYLRAGDTLELNYDERGAHVTIGAQLASWRFLNGQWRCHCSCGYPDSHCFHIYMVHLLLRDISRLEGWPLKNLQEGKSPQERPQRTSPTRPGPLFQGTLPFQSTPHPAPSSPSATSSAAPLKQGDFLNRLSANTVQKAKLTVELDFKMSHIDVGVRFYVTKEGQRSLQRLSAIRNMAYDYCQATQERPCHYLWSAEDGEFLKWVFPILRGKTFSSLEGTMLPLSKETVLKEWLSRWGSHKERLLERSTQLPINPNQVDTPVSLQFELYRSEQNGEYSLGAVFIMADGRRFHLHQLVDCIKHDVTQSVVATKLKAFVPPVPWQLLLDHFGVSTEALGRSHLCEKIQCATGGHLELLKEGPYVKKQVIATRGLGIKADVIKDRFVIKLSLPGYEAAQLNGEVAAYLQPAPQGVLLVLNELVHLKDIQRILQEAGAIGEGSSFELPADAKGAESIQALWHKLPDSLDKRYSAPLKFLLGRREDDVRVQLRGKSQGPLVEMSAVCLCGDERISLSAIKEAIFNERQYLRTDSGAWLHVEPERIKEIMQSFSDNGLNEKSSYFLPDQAQHLFKESEEHPFVELAPFSATLAETLKQESFPPVPEIPSSLKPILRAYQKTGINFLAERARYGIGTILADDMGLGKTLQVLTLLKMHQEMTPDFSALVVTPASVMEVWKEQAQRFFPEFKVALLNGTKEQRQRIFSREKADLFVTHYGLLRIDAEMLKSRLYTFLVLDEAQAIKNPEAQVTLAARSLKAEHKVAMTGTPLENSLVDLWSLMDFLNPGLLGRLDSFYEHSKESDGLEHLRHRLALLMLRRTKAMVAPELPPRTEQLITLPLSPDIQQVYDRLLLQERETARGKGIAGLLAAITKLRRFCCAPELVLDQLPQGLGSPKLDYLLERLELLHSTGHSVLVFSQYTTVLELLEKRLTAQKLPHSILTGQTPPQKRGEIVRAFNEGASESILLLSLKAAGTGLTLTRADYVYLLDPWWNPAVENQAIDRTHRIGQDKPVFAYRIALSGTIEEKVLAIVQEKRELFAKVVDGIETTGNDSRLSLEELQGLLEVL